MPPIVARASKLLQDAERVFAQASLPDRFAFVDRLSALHQRQFYVELYEQLSRCTLLHAAGCDHLETLVDGWEATADLDSDPEALAALRRPDTVHRPLKV